MQSKRQVFIDKQEKAKEIRKIENWFLNIENVAIAVTFILSIIGTWAYPTNSMRNSTAPGRLCVSDNIIWGLKWGDARSLEYVLERFREGCNPVRVSSGNHQWNETTPIIKVTNVRVANAWPLWKGDRRRQMELFNPETVGGIPRLLEESSELDSDPQIIPEGTKPNRAYHQT